MQRQTWLKEIYYAHFSFITMFWVFTKTGLQSVMFKQHISSLILSSAAVLYFPAV